jgi:hypothetical protein
MELLIEADDSNPHGSFTLRDAVLVPPEPLEGPDYHLLIRLDCQALVVRNIKAEVPGQS